METFRKNQCSAGKIPVLFSGFGVGVLVNDEHAVRRKIVVADDILVGQEIVHRLVELNANLGVLVVEQKKDA